MTPHRHNSSFSWHTLPFWKTQRQFSFQPITVDAYQQCHDAVSFTFEVGEWPLKQAAEVVTNGNELNISRSSEGQAVPDPLY